MYTESENYKNYYTEPILRFFLQNCEKWRFAPKIFVNEEAVKQWFQTPNYALGNQKPLDLLDTSFGVKMVTDVLGRIEHGVFS